LETLRHKEKRCLFIAVVPFSMQPGLETVRYNGTGQDRFRKSTGPVKNGKSPVKNIFNLLCSPCL
jgi:hypothetical protein